MAIQEEIRSEGVSGGQDDDFNDFHPALAALPDQQAFTEPGTSETQVGIWREEGPEDPEHREGDGGQEEEIECLGGLRPTDPEENASLEECMALVTAVKARNPVGVLQGKRGAYWEDVLKDLQAERFFKEKKTPFLKMRMAELLHLHQHAEYVNEDNTDENREGGGTAGGRVGVQTSGQGQRQYRAVGFCCLANKKNFSLTENSVSAIKNMINHRGYLISIIDEFSCGLP